VRLNFIKKSDDEELELDELEEYDCRQNLEIVGIPYKTGEDVTKITIDLANKLDVKLCKEDISIAHGLPLKQRRVKTPEGMHTANKHPAIIV